MTEGWPALPLAEWQATRDTLQLWTQIVGKVRMVRTPLMSHWWNVPLYVTARGLSTSMIPAEGRGFQIDFDFTTHRLDIITSDGGQRSTPLEARPVADFYADVMAMLDDLGLTTSIWTMPVEIPGAVIPFDKDDVHASYDRDQVERFWRALIEMVRVFEQFRSEFLGKVSPVHLFWGGLDLAVTRFSGRPAPPHPGGAPNCGPQVMLEAYSHEVSSAGYWPGPDGEGIFYSYAYPEPDGYRQQPVAPAAARFDETLGEFVLPYEIVRTAPDPDAVLLEFLHTTYAAAADTAGWSRGGARTMSPADGYCTHLATVSATISGVVPSSPGCEDCLRIGGRWVHLRMCMHCGHIGCCDNSPNRHATAHWHEHPDHPIIRSYEPGEDWWWCYPDELFFEVDDAPPSPSHP